LSECLATYSFFFVPENPAQSVVLSKKQFRMCAFLTLVLMNVCHDQKSFEKPIPDFKHLKRLFFISVLRHELTWKIEICSTTWLAKHI